MRILITLQKQHPSAHVPAYATPGSAGMDLCAVEAFILEPGERQLISTGFSMALPEGYEGQIRPRSGLALKHGVTVLNAPGTLDSDYRGEVKVLLINHGKTPFPISPGDRIAQLVVSQVAQATWEEVATLPVSTERGEGGFGSTGTRAA